MNLKHSAGPPKRAEFQDKEKPAQIRSSNITAGKAVADAIKTSLGPRGMDKMIQDKKGEVTITNDGATILKQMKVLHPAAKMLVELSQAQDAEAGDGTTSVVILAGALLEASQKLLSRGIHPARISDSLLHFSSQAQVVLESMAIPVDLSDRNALLNSANTALNSKVVHEHSGMLAPMAVDAVCRLVDPAKDTHVDLKDIRITMKLGETVEDSKLIDGIIFTQKTQGFGGPNKVEKAKIGLIQFCISPPKTDMDNTVIVRDYAAMDRILREERQYILNITKKIKAAGCNVLLIQKSILRDAVSDLALHLLAKQKIMVVKDIEREDIEFVCKSLGCRPVASLDHFTPEILGSAELCEEVQTGNSKLVTVTGVQNPGRAVSILLRGSNKQVLEEADRSLHDALCVIRCLVKKRYLVPGGGAPEAELAVRLTNYGQTLQGMDAYCFRVFAEALEVIPSILAENAGLTPISTVTELRNRHARGETSAGINVRKGWISNIVEEKVLQPLLVSSSAIMLAAECVRSILKIDDIMPVVR
ncbi:T-complex protein 1 subunit delta [Hyalella azteca]|uniref:T-complex protein 1 subunit delta n=1 Tax=Hyalella azteca TaxID=294128 RepID=A0A8B7P3X0_HYAAZ|nr:T-complex protein 1 subunit delta [Hyalella azteca]